MYIHYMYIYYIKCSIHYYILYTTWCMYLDSLTLCVAFFTVLQNLNFSRLAGALSSDLSEILPYLFV